jgi:hypothetical protein
MSHPIDPIHEEHPLSTVELLTQSCQLITRPPRILAGVFSAAYTGTVEALGPIPNPRRNRQMKSWYQFWVVADPMTDNVQKMPQKKMVPRRPKMLFKGSVSQHPTSHEPMYGLMPIAVWEIWDNGACEKFRWLSGSFGAER